METQFNQLLNDIAKDLGPYIVGILFFGALFYFLPTIVAASRKHHNLLAIFVLNLTLGWTFIGWAIALVWSCTQVTARTQANTNSNKPQEDPIMDTEKPFPGPGDLMDNCLRLLLPKEAFCRYLYHTGGRQQAGDCNLREILVTKTNAEVPARMWTGSSQTPLLTAVCLLICSLPFFFMSANPNRSSAIVPALALFAISVFVGIAFLPGRMDLTANALRFRKHPFVPCKDLTLLPTGNGISVTYVDAYPSHVKVKVREQDAVIIRVDRKKCRIFAEAISSHVAAIERVA